jgi:hypothetical protein
MTPAGSGATPAVADAVGARLLTDDPVTAAEQMPTPGIHPPCRRPTAGGALARFEGKPLAARQPIAGGSMDPGHFRDRHDLALEHVHDEYGSGLPARAVVYRPGAARAAEHRRLRNEEARRRRFSRSGGEGRSAT